MSDSSFSSSSSSEDDVIEALQYRFSGYQLYLVQWDETGPAYAITGVNPYYKNQPEYWTKPYQTGAYWNTSPRSEQVNVTVINSSSKSKKSSTKSTLKSKENNKRNKDENKRNKLYPFDKI
jgi:hypothetical protein